MNKQEIYDFIKSKNIWYEITEHKAVFNMNELSEIEVPYPEYDAKNLFVRDDKKRNYYLITVKGDKRVDLKEFRKQNNTRPLSFASEQDLMSIMNLIAGSVTPLGLLNDKEFAKKNNLPVIATMHSQYKKDFLRAVKYEPFANILTKVIIEQYNRCDKVISDCT